MKESQMFNCLLKFKMVPFSHNIFLIWVFMNFKQNAKKSFPKIIGLAKNYSGHAIQLGSAVPSKPLIFLKSWSSISYNPDKLLLLNSNNDRINHQLELGVYINKGGKNILKQNAMEHVGGYFIGIDFTDRYFHDLVKKGAMPQALAKAQDNFCPVSQLIPKEIDPYSVELQLIVNGKTRQKDFAQNMHFKIDEIISYISTYIKLDDGDLILTGTPDGVGSVVSGDKVLAYGKVEGQIIAKLQFSIEA